MKYLLLILPLAACMPSQPCIDWRCGPDSAGPDSAAPAAPDRDHDEGKPDRGNGKSDKGEKGDQGKGKGEGGHDD